MGPWGNADSTPDSQSFTVSTAGVSVSDSTLTVAAATGARDNVVITSTSASTLRVTDLPGGAYTGSGIHTGTGCTRTGDYAASCSAPGADLVKVTAGDRADRVVNSTAVKSFLIGGKGNDVLTGGSANDALVGAAGADAFSGMNGNDQLFARDFTSDRTINCGGGTADKAGLDVLPKDPNSVITGCETRTRP